MRILLLNMAYRPDVAASGQLLGDLAESLVERDHEVHVICANRYYGVADGLKLPPQETIAGVQVHRVATTGRGRRRLLGRMLDFASFGLSASACSWRLGHFDLCISFTSPPYIGLVGLLHQSIFGGRHLVWINDLYPQVLCAQRLIRTGCLIDSLLSDLSRSIYQRSDGIISIGSSMTQRLLDLRVNRDRLITIDHWVPGLGNQVLDTTALDRQADSLRRQWDLPPRDQAMVVMYSGNLGMLHDSQTIETVIKNSHDDPTLHWLFVGGGAEYERLRIEFGNQPYCTFRPHVPLQQLGASLRVADVHWASLRPEAVGLIMPSKLYSILVAGRPLLCIGPSQSDIALLVERAQSGCVVANGDSAAIRRLLQEWRDPRLRSRLGRNGQEYYDSHLGFTLALDTIDKIIHESARFA